MAGSSAAWSPDGTRILIGRNDQTATVRDATSGEEIFSLKGHTREISSVVWSPDGRRILTGSKDGTAKVWDAERSQEPLTLRGYTGSAWSPDSRRILSVSFGDAKSAKVWDVESGHEDLTLKWHKAVLTSLTWSPDGRRILIGSTDKTATVWDAESGQKLRSLEGHSEQVSSVAWSPNGRRLLTGSWDKTAKVWDAESSKELLTLNDPGGPIYSVKFESRQPTHSHRRGRCEGLGRGERQELLSLKGHFGVSTVAWSPDGRRILTGVWDSALEPRRAAPPSRELGQHGEGVGRRVRTGTPLSQRAHRSAG